MNKKGTITGFLGTVIMGLPILVWLILSGAIGLSSAWSIISNAKFIIITIAIVFIILALIKKK